MMNFTSILRYLPEAKRSCAFEIVSSSQNQYCIHFRWLMHRIKYTIMPRKDRNKIFEACGASMIMQNKLLSVGFGLASLQPSHINFE